MQLLAGLPDGYADEVFVLRGCDSAVDITPGEVASAIRRLRNNKALGDSWISADLLKSLDESFCVALATLFNKVRHEGTPCAWNKLSLISLHKKGSL